MNILNVELIKTKFIAYEFDGSEQQAKEFCNMWNFSYIRDKIYPTQFCVRTSLGELLCKDSYLVKDGDAFKTYTKEKFYSTFSIIRQSRDRYDLDKLMAS
jgi:hypothetical protein